MPVPRSAAERVRATVARLESERDVWLSSVGDGAPWLVPLWFVRQGGVLLLATGAHTRTARNLSGSPAARLALPSTDDVVIIDGTAEVTPIADADPGPVAAFAAKYADPDPHRWAEAVITVRMRRVQAWRGEHEIPGRVIMRDGTWVTGMA